MKLSHVNKEGKAQMVNVAEKASTLRTAVAGAKVFLGEEIVSLLQNNPAVNAKGPVLHTAMLAGIMAAKKTGDLIPLCHPIGLENCQLTFEFISETDLEITCTASVNAKTGVEMEALTGASVAALTVYDMCKAVSHGIIIKEIKLISKKGGKSDFSL